VEGGSVGYGSREWMRVNGRLASKDVRGGE
jgi:hypothetical protein